MKYLIPILFSVFLTSTCFGQVYYKSGKYTRDEITEIALNLFQNNVSEAKLVIKHKGSGFDSREKVYFKFFPNSTLRINDNFYVNYFKYDTTISNFRSIPGPLGPWTTENHKHDIDIITDSSRITIDYYIKDGDTTHTDINQVVIGNNRTIYYNESINSYQHNKDFIEIIDQDDGKYVINNYKYRDNKWDFSTSYFISKSITSESTNKIVETSVVHTYYGEQNEMKYCLNTDASFTKITRYDNKNRIKSIKIKLIENGFERQLKNKIIFKIKVKE